MKRTIKFFRLLAFLSAAVFVFHAPIVAQTKQEILIVADAAANCASGIGAATAANCLQVKRINEEKFTLMSEPIENFQFLPGYFYLLEVSASTAANPPADASKFKYRLEKILARVKAEDSSTQPNFSGTEWKLTRIEGGAVKGDKAFIKFEEEKNAVAGNGGCNTFTGSLAKNGNQIKMPEIFATKMFCNEISVSEIKFLGALDYVTRYEITGEKLKLFAGDKVVLEFEAKK